MRRFDLLPIAVCQSEYLVLIHPIGSKSNRRTAPPTFAALLSKTVRSVTARQVPPGIQSDTNYSHATHAFNNASICSRPRNEARIVQRVWALNIPITSRKTL